MVIPCRREKGWSLLITVPDWLSPPLQNLYESIKNEPFKIPEDDGNDLTHTFFNPDREGWLLKLGEPGGAGPGGAGPGGAGPAPGPLPLPTAAAPGLLALLLLWSHSPQLQDRKIKKKSAVKPEPTLGSHTPQH